MPVAELLCKMPKIGCLVLHYLNILNLHVQLPLPGLHHRLMSAGIRIASLEMRYCSLTHNSWICLLECLRPFVKRLTIRSSNSLNGGWPEILQTIGEMGLDQLHLSSLTDCWSLTGPGNPALDLRTGHGGWRTHRAFRESSGIQHYVIDVETAWMFGDEGIRERVGLIVRHLLE